MRPLVQWLSVMALVTLLDLLARFWGEWDMGRILWVEAVLFPIAGLGLLRLLILGPRLSGFPRKAQIVVIAGLFLAGLRSGLWASGMPIGRVNLLVLAVAVLALLVFRILRGKGR